MESVGKPNQAKIVELPLVGGQISQPLIPKKLVMPTVGLSDNNWSDWFGGLWRPDSNKSKHATRRFKIKKRTYLNMQPIHSNKFKNINA